MSDDRIIYSLPADYRLAAGSNRVVFHDPWPVRMLARQYRRLRQAGASPVLARMSLFDAVFYSTIYATEFIGSGER